MESKFWTKRTKRQKYLIFIFAVLIIVLVILFVTLATFFYSSSPQLPSAENAFLTSNYPQIASQMIDFMDKNVEPCDNFFEFACGGFKRYSLSSNRTDYGQFQIILESIQKKMRELLEKPIISNECLAIQKVKRFYISCLNISTLEKQDEQPLMRAITKMGGWPLLTDISTDKPLDFSAQLVRLTMLGQRVFIHVDVEAIDNSNRSILMISPGRIGMPLKDYLLRSTDSKVQNAYQTMAMKVALMLGASEKNINTDISEMIEFENKIAILIYAEEKKKEINCRSSIITLEELSIQFSNFRINWTDYLVTLFKSVNITLYSNDTMIHCSSHYLLNITKLINNTSNRIIANFLVWQFVNNNTELLRGKLFNIKNEFNKNFIRPKELSRWQSCLSTTNENFGMIIGRMYVEKHFDKKSKETALILIKYLLESFKQLLNNVTWLQDDTKKIAEEKINAMQQKMGYPNYIYNDAYLNSEVEEMKFSIENNFENILSFNAAFVRNNLKQLRQHIDINRWKTHPTVIDALYDPRFNRISFPAGVLQQPFYHKDNPMFLNFGGIGMIIGHEITHGFDDKSRYINDVDKKEDLGDAEDSDMFKKQKQCFINQYNKYTIPETNLTINGTQTLVENIADNSGLKQSFKAYQNWVKENGPETALPGLNMTTYQIFFLRFAQIWCSLSKKENLIQKSNSTAYSPTSIRVIGALSNSHDFAKVFNCSLDSPMNPSFKCPIW